MCFNASWMKSWKQSASVTSEALNAPPRSSRSRALGSPPLVAFCAPDDTHKDTHRLGTWQKSARTSIFRKIAISVLHALVSLNKNCTLIIHLQRSRSRAATALRCFRFSFRFLLLSFALATTSTTLTTTAAGSSALRAQKHCFRVGVKMGGFFWG